MNIEAATTFGCEKVQILSNALKNTGHKIIRTHATLKGYRIVFLDIDDKEYSVEITLPKLNPVQNTISDEAC